MPDIGDADGTLGMPLHVLLRRCAQEGREWFEAELALTRAEAAAWLRRLVVAAVLACLATALLLATLVVAMNAAVLGLAQWSGDLLTAALVVTAVSFLITLAIAAIAWSLARQRWNPASFVLQWVAGASGSEGHADAIPQRSAK